MQDRRLTMKVPITMNRADMQLLVKNHYEMNYPLHCAVIKCDLNEVGLLLEDGISIDEKDDCEKTPLHRAVCNIEDPQKKYEVCEFLLDHGAYVDELDDLELRTPLHYLWEQGVQKDGGKLLGLFILRNADINKKDYELCTPLHFATAANDTESVEEFLRLGASVNVVADKCHNRIRPTALSQAVDNRNVNMIKLLLRYGANIHHPSVLYAAAELESREILQILFAYGVDYEKYDFPQNKQCTNFIELFQHIIHNDWFNTAECLIDNGVDLRVHEFCFLNIVCELSYESRMYWFDNNRQKILNVILRDIAVMEKSDGKSVPELTMQFIAENSTLKTKYDDYAQQIDWMKKTMLHENSRFNYSDLLTKRRDVVTRFCNADILLAPLVKESQMLFPDFTDRLKRTVERGLSDRKVIESLESMLYEALQTKLSFDLVRYICSFLTLSDMVQFRFLED